MEIIGGLELGIAELVLLTEFEILKHFSLGAELSASNCFHYLGLKLLGEVGPGVTN